MERIKKTAHTPLPHARMAKIRAPFLLLILLAACSAWQVEAQTMDEVVAQALSGNPGLRAIQDGIAEMKAEGPGNKLFEKFELGVAGSWRQDSSGGTPGASISLSGPLLPQLSLNASYDFDEGASSFGASFTPFSKSLDSVNWTDALNGRDLVYKEESARVRSRAENFYVSMVTAQARLKIAETRFTLAELPFKNSEFKYASGLLSYTKYKESVQAYKLRLQDLLNAERELLNLRKSALEVFGNATILATAPAWSITETELLDRSARLEAVLAAAANPKSAELSRLEAELGKLEREQASTPGWQPKFTIAAATESFFSTIDASLGISFSLDQIQSDEKSKLGVKIQTKRQEVERKRLELGYTTRLLRLQCEKLEEGIAVHRLAVTLADGAYAEAQVHYKAGALDSASLESARLDTLEARLSLVQAAAELMTSWQDLHVYFLNVSVDGGK